MVLAVTSALNFYLKARPTCLTLSLVYRSVPYSPKLLARTMASFRSPARRFSFSGFVELNHTERIEEETLQCYDAEKYYPVRLGDVFRSRYQTIAKLGYGVSSTVWLCRDLR
jgi:hypothetical protein